MITGMSFGRGVLFHDTKVMACAEVKNGVIHLWAEKISLRTIGKVWYRVLFTLPWPYQLFHLALLVQSIHPVIQPWSNWWTLLYIVGFHFVFPRRMKQFHGAEHKVFSYPGEKKLEALPEIKQASIVNSGCSTNYVTYFFVSFLASCCFLPMSSSVAAGFVGLIAGVLGERYLRHRMRLLFRLSAFLQKHVTTREPERVHLETAVRSYQLLQHMQAKSAL